MHAALWLARRQGIPALSQAGVALRAACAAAPSSHWCWEQPGPSRVALWVPCVPYSSKVSPQPVVAPAAPKQHKWRPTRRPSGGVPAASVQLFQPARAPRKTGVFADEDSKPKQTSAASPAGLGAVSRWDREEGGRGHEPVAWGPRALDPLPGLHVVPAAPACRLMPGPRARNPVRLPLNRHSKLLAGHGPRCSTCPMPCPWAACCLAPSSGIGSCRAR